MKTVLSRDPFSFVSHFGGVDIYFNPLMNKPDGGLWMLKTPQGVVVSENAKYKFMFGVFGVTDETVSWCCEQAMAKVSKFIDRYKTEPCTTA